MLCVQPSAEPIHRVAADVAVVAFFEDERPLRGAAGLADWRLCGALSQLIRAERFRGAAGEAALVPTRGGLRAPLVLAVGLGRREALVAAVRVERLEEALTRALALRVVDLVTALPPASPGDEGVGDQVEALLGAASRAARASEGVPPDARLRVVAPPELRPTLFDDLRRRAAEAVLPPGLVIEMPPTEGPRRRTAAATAAPGSPELRVK